MQPFDYRQQVANPFQQAIASAAQGFQLGAGMREMQERRAAAEQSRIQQEQLNRAVNDLLVKPNPTFADYERVIAVAPKDRGEMLLKSWEQKNKQQQQSTLREAGQVINALRSNPQAAVDMLNQKAEAARNSGEEQTARAYETWASTAKANPDTAVKMISMDVAYLPGAKEFFEMAGIGGEQFQVLSADVVKSLGLPEGPTYQRNTRSGKIERLTETSKFEMLSGAEAQGLGLPAGTYQRDSVTGKITAVGPGGVTIKMPPQIGSIPPDYRLNYDEQGRPMSMEVIPGSKTERELREAETARASQAQTTLRSADVVTDEIGRLRNLIQKQTVADPVTGRTGAIMGRAGVLAAGSARRTAEETISTITANIGFDRLQQMRNESPTGGALGNVSNIELAQLQNVLGSINLEQDEKAILDKLTRLERIYGEIMRKAAAYPNAAKYGFGPGAPQRTETINVGGQTYARPQNFTDQQWADYKRAMGVQR